MLKIYQFLIYIFIPIILINLFIRIIKNKEDKKRYAERLGRTRDNFNLSKKIIWLHSTSVGEFKSIDIIIEKYHKNFNILVTTTTKTSAEYIKKNYSDKVIHQYMPFDVPIWCSKFINYWKPSLILWIESDIWPNMLKIIRDKNINCLYINARISPKSFNKWKYVKNFYSKSLSTFNKIFVQSPNDLKRIEFLINRKVEYIGNLKLSNNNKKIIAQNNQKIFSIMIVSSHESEEEKIINSIENIIKSKKMKLCIAPRHPERINEISKILEKFNLSYCLSSEEQMYKNDVIIVDGFGYLDSYFNKSEIVILGGSFVKKGGHNPLEPARYNCALISGSFVYNWQNVYDEMAKENACIIINDINDLKNIINEIVSNKILLEKLMKKALNFSNKKFFDNETLFKQINLVLK